MSPDAGSFRPSTFAQGRCKAGRLSPATPSRCPVSKSGGLIQPPTTARRVCGVKTLLLCCLFCAEYMLYLLLYLRC